MHRREFDRSSQWHDGDRRALGLRRLVAESARHRVAKRLQQGDKSKKFLCEMQDPSRPPRSLHDSVPKHGPRVPSRRKLITAANVGSRRVRFGMLWVGLANRANAPTRVRSGLG
jgi:hypothetical protein